MLKFLKNMFSKKPVIHLIRCRNCGCRFEWIDKYRNLKCPNCGNTNLKKFSEISKKRSAK